MPYGDIVDATPDAPTLTFNTIGRHQSRLVRTRISSNLSPWLSQCSLDDPYTVAISHGEGRFVANDEVLAQLIANGQVATQYVGEDGKPSMDLSVNPNGSALAIEGITSLTAASWARWAMPSVVATTCTATCPSMSPAISLCRSLRAA